MLHNLIIAENIRTLMDKGRKRLRAPDDEDEEGPSLGLGYSKPEAKKSFSGGEGSGSSLNFINFTKAGTNLDGSRSSKTSVDKKYEQSKTASKPTDISNLEMKGEIDNKTLKEAAQYLERFHINLKKTMNSFLGQKLTVQQNFCNAAQACLIYLHPVSSFLFLSTFLLDHEEQSSVPV